MLNLVHNAQCTMLNGVHNVQCTMHSLVQNAELDKGLLTESITGIY